MEVGRRQHTLTLLPDGRVLATGGSSATGFDNPAGADYRAEIWDPCDEKWTEMAAETHYRGYHSTALLLAGTDGCWSAAAGIRLDGRPAAELEIYSPPYLFRGGRPQVARRLHTWRTPHVHRRDAGHRVYRGRDVDPARVRDARFQCGPAHQPSGVSRGPRMVCRSLRRPTPTWRRPVKFKLRSICPSSQHIAEAVHTSLNTSSGVGVLIRTYP